MAHTPSSDKSLYFDAPITHFHTMSSQSPPLPAEEAAVQQPAEAVEGKVTVMPNNESSGWLPATDSPVETNGVAPKESIMKTPSVAAGAQLNGHARSVSVSAAPRRSGSLSRPSLFTNADGQAVEGSGFIGGAVTTGPNSTAEKDEQLHRRATSADASLTPKQRSKIAKAEAKDGKRLSKIIKEEAKVEKKALNVAINELQQLQKLQKAAVGSEAKANTAHTKVLAEFQKLEAIFLAARTKYEAAQSRLRSAEETLEIVRNNTKDANDRLQEKSQQVDSLRTMYGVDERERAAKLSEIAAEQKSGGGWFSK